MSSETEPAETGGAPARPLDLGRGTNQTGVRLYNERLILSILRRHGSQPKAEIARMTGLSAQTVSIIARQLEADGLIRRLAPVKGRVGQPSVPFALAPEGAFSIGLKIGRRSCDLVLIDFLGRVRAEQRRSYRYPDPAALPGLVAAGLEALAGGLGAAQRARICGLGLAAPFELWSWHQEIGAPQEALDGWRSFDLRGEFEAISPWPVYVCNDATAACAAELLFGKGGALRDFLYLFVGYFIGGGVVLDGMLVPGPHGNAGAVGSMPIATGDPKAPLRQLIQCASIHRLEKLLILAGRDPHLIWRSLDDWSAVGSLLDPWIEETARSIAQAAVAAISVIDFEAVVIDGAFPPAVRTRIAGRVREEVAGLDLQGLSPVEILTGEVGWDARAVGGASLPLLANFTRDREVLFREAG